MIEPAIQSWWATDDFPVCKASRSAFLVDGRMTMLEMCLHFLCAKHAIHITAWSQPRWVISCPIFLPGGRKSTR